MPNPLNRDSFYLLAVTFVAEFQNPVGLVRAGTQPVGGHSVHRLLKQFR